MASAIPKVGLVAEAVAALASAGYAGLAAWATTKLGTIALGGLGGSVAAFAVMMVVKMLAGSDSDIVEKMMKAPGQDFKIPRREFESNPAAWFRSHRS